MNLFFIYRVLLALQQISISFAMIYYSFEQPKYLIIYITLALLRGLFLFFIEQSIDAWLQLYMTLSSKS